MTFVNTKLSLWNYFPEFKKMVESNTVPKFGGDMTEKNKSRISELEDEYKDLDLKVIAVIEHDFIDTIATAYIYVDNEDTSQPFESECTAFFWAQVDNHEYEHNSEMGLVGIVEVNGQLKRVA